MTESAFEIRHGEFRDVLGASQRWGEVTFVPAEVQLNGTSFERVFDLADCLSRASPTAKAIVQSGRDAPWVLGRLMRLFGTQQIPQEDRGEKTCFFASFLAVLHDSGNAAIPFECSDVYGRTSLLFSSDDPPNQQTQSAIAESFWGLLLADPTNLADYQGQLLHLGAPITFHFGVKDGEPFMIEEPDAD